jgi:two-component system sensor histidine kinase/response regulator
MGGDLGVESAPGRTEFTFSVPLQPAPESEEASAEAAPLANREALVVEGHPVAREALTVLLRSLGARVRTAATREEAEGALVHSPALLVVDDLADWTAPDLIEAVRARRMPELGVLLLRTHDADPTAHWRLTQAAGVIGAAKPLGRGAVVRALAELRSREASSASAGAATGDPRERGPLAGARVLLVEDDELNQEVALRQLEQAGVVVTVVTNGKEATQRVADGFDAVLMDVQMPVMDGYEATRTIRADERFQKLPIIALTAGALDSDRIRCLEAGMNDHVSKPIDPSRLFAALERWIAPRTDWDTRDLPEPAAGASEPGASEAEATPAAPPASAAALGLPELPGIDTRGALERLEGDREEYAYFVGRFRQLQADAPTQIRSFHEAGQREDAERAAHSLKSVAAIVGAVDLAEASKALEFAFRGGGEDTAVTPALARVEVALRATLEAFVQLEAALTDSA